MFHAMLHGETILCWAPNPWHSPWRNRHQIMTRLARQNLVIYAEPRPYWRQVLRGAWMQRGPALEYTSEGVWVYRSPAWAPIAGRSLVGKFTARLRHVHLRRSIAPLPMGEGPGVRVRKPILWLFSPDQGDLIGTCYESLVIYHVVDEYSAYESGYGSSTRQEAIRQAEQAILAQADLVFVVSAELLVRKRAFNPHTYLVPNGVDNKAFAAALESAISLPAPLARVPRPRLGYVGVINDKIDLELLRQVAHAEPGWNLVLIGPDERRHTRHLGSLEEFFIKCPNVWCLGAVPPSQVPYVMRGLDVGLMPYRINEWTQHISPLKLYEYLAAGRPIVSTDIPAVRPFSPPVHIATSVPLFVSSVAQALDENKPEQIAARCALTKDHTWEARVELLSDLIERRTRELKTKN